METCTNYKVPSKVSLKIMKNTIQKKCKATAGKLLLKFNLNYKYNSTIAKVICNCLKLHHKSK